MGYDDIHRAIACVHQGRALRIEMPGDSVMLIAPVAAPERRENNAHQGRAT